MIRGFSSRRAADEFEALLSGSADGQVVRDAEYAELLEVVGTLRALPEVSARPSFVADLRTRLVAEAAAPPARAARPIDAALVARLTPTQRGGANERRLATVLGGFAVVAGTGSMAMASQAALPGDSLYPMKRAIENAQTNLQSDDAGKVATLLGQAEQRLSEVEALNDRDDDAADEITSTLQDFSEQTNQAAVLAIDEYEESGHASSLQEVRDFASRTMGTLTALGDELPDEARPALISAAQTVRQVDSAAQQVCPTCGGSIAELPEFATKSLESLVLDDLVEAAQAVEQREFNVAPPRQKDQKPDRDTDDPATDDDPVVDPGTTVDEPTEDGVPDDNDGPLGDLGDGLGETLSGNGGKHGKDGSGKKDDVVGDVVEGVDGLLGGLDGLLGSE